MSHAVKTKRVPAAIHRLGREIGQRFHAEQVVLFGSHARGAATSGSDVDLLVIMQGSGRDSHRAAEILATVRSPLPLDVLVRAPKTVRQRIAMGDCFMQDIIASGVVLYEAQGHRSGVGGKSPGAISGSCSANIATDAARVMTPCASTPSNVSRNI